MKNINKLQRNILFLFLTILVCLINYRIIFGPKKSSSEPKKSSKIKGIDISNKYSGILDWKKLSSYNGFVILRAVRNVDTVKAKGVHSFVSIIDSNFKKNWESLKRQNIPRGAYHRFSANISAEKQFEIFKNAVDLHKGDLPPFLDVEEHASITEIKKWIELAKKYYKVDPILYDNYEHFIKYKDSLESYKVWIYINQGLPINSSLKSINSVIWQYNQNKTIKGFSEPADLNEFLGDSLAFKELLIK